jgi:hypothetical protein
MNPTQAEYCRKQAERLFSLANECIDPQICEQVRAMATEWAEMASSKRQTQLDRSADLRSASLST